MGLLWNEKSDKVYGLKDLFNDKEDFINKVKKELEEFNGRECNVLNITIQPCIVVGEKSTTTESYYAASVQEIK